MRRALGFMGASNPVGDLVHAGFELLFADRDGNVWVTDGRGGNGKGHTVIKFSSDGKVLMTLACAARNAHTADGAAGSAFNPCGTLVSRVEL
jgi:hypothetical protein